MSNLPSPGRTLSLDSFKPILLVHTLSEKQIRFSIDRATQVFPPRSSNLDAPVVQFCVVAESKELKQMSILPWKKTGKPFLKVYADNKFTMFIESVAITVGQACDVCMREIPGNSSKTTEICTHVSTKSIRNSTIPVVHRGRNTKGRNKLD
jgi:hypothetical protein